MYSEGDTRNPILHEENCEILIKKKINFSENYCYKYS